WPGQLPPAFKGSRPGAMIVTAAVALAALMAIGVAGAWPTVLLALNGQPFGYGDPILGRDAGFFVFTLPALDLAQGVAGAFVVTAFLGAVVIYGLGGLMSLRRRTFDAPRRVRAHLSLLGALWALTWAASEMLARYRLLSTPRPGGGFSGAGYADVHARLPGHNVAAVAAVVVAVALLGSVWARRWWPAAAAVAAAITLRAVLVGVYPSLLQQYGVVPNELVREQPFIAYNITATLRAHGLDTVQETEYDPRQTFTQELLEEHAATFDNVRLWDWRVMERTFQQRQEIRPLYEFLDVDIDRYRLPGQEVARQVELAARELMPSQIQNPTWVNRHLEFTHGFGAVVAPVDETDAQGQPVLWMKDIPPEVRAPFSVEVTQPRIYFGEAAAEDYVVVGSERDEFDYPSGAGKVTTRYSGADGIAVATYLRRAMFALRFGDIEILLSDVIGAESRILLHRQIRERVRRLAPFLRYDPDPYLVIDADGRFVWLLDAYTATDRFPFSAPIPATDPNVRALAGANYIRNSVKVTIDAYDGTVRFFVVDPGDPIITAWARVFPDLFTFESMSSDLMDHWRYPEALFRAQSMIYTLYHMKSAAVFYNAEDRWEIPRELHAGDDWQQVQPYYVTVRLRGEEQPEFVLMLPFSPINKRNMIAWLAARSDPEHYGELVVYSFIKGEFVIGPELVESRIDQVPDISMELTLLGQKGSRTIRGNLLVIPVENALVFVEPLYLEAARQESALPELKRVIVATGDKIVMRDTLDEALAAVVGAGPPVVDEAATRGEAVPGAPEPAVPDLVGDLRDQWQRAEDARREGDWETFGREMDALDTALSRLERAAGLATPTPAPE
ncbi:MAG: UPF0182 family protein, partial [Anaerolineae bacterium]